MYLRFLYILSFLLGTFLSHAQLELDWFRSQGGILLDNSADLATDSANDTYVVGFFQDTMDTLTSVGDKDMFLAKYNESGQLLWQKSWGNSGDDRLNTVCTAEGGIYIAGQFSGTLIMGEDTLQTVGETDVLCAKLDFDGNVLWAVALGGTGMDAANMIALDAQSNIAITGYFEDSIQFEQEIYTCRGFRDAFLIQLDSTGQVIWSSTFGGPFLDEGTALVYDDLGNLYCSGYYRDALFLDNDTLLAIGNNDVFIVSMDTQGTERWMRSMGGNYADNCTELCIDRHGDLYAVGWYDRQFYLTTDSLYATGVEGEDAYIAKYTNDGTLAWAKSYGGLHIELFYGAAIDPSGNLSILAVFDSAMTVGVDTFDARHINIPTDIAVLGLDSMGKINWLYTFGDIENDFAYGMNWTEDSSLYIVGNFKSQTSIDGNSYVSAGDFDGFLAKFSIDSSQIQWFSTPVDLLPEKAISQLRIFPNPTTDIVQIQWDKTDLLQDLNHLDTKYYLYSAAGYPLAVIPTRFDEVQQLDLSIYPAGIYYLVYIYKGQKQVCTISKRGD
ncbi:MAG: T9SS type A sorting domain-containing protein [Saprospiraceae bacterium]|nr:T9SS type A sorting domain-containing protein [Saprospiraceae bacterium]